LARSSSWLILVVDVAPANADDAAIWQRAISDQRVIVTKDED
jgi:predicted nuclease of predicted toxin-antitoxin system